ncbi:ABC transporter ATP-binding protein [Paraburkholderia sp. 22B1P]|uniref:ABC transporter ATP-binding protein n=1 Tax=Paraburkholderia sp. 22B1P TaxID=3080498 RepID=UPI00308A6304|nr:ABC transporter ATP-binding protein [Paraburkholderia sp. 22B1P]
MNFPHPHPSLQDIDAASVRATAFVGPEVHATLSGVTRFYNKAGSKDLFHALGPIDLNLYKSEFFSVVGPSGCGKSTLLDALTGLAKPSGGTVTFEGKPVNGVPDGVGVVFQEDASYPWLNVRDNISFGLRAQGYDGVEIKRRVDYAMGFMGLRDFALAFPAQLSGGMRQRVCIARTLVMQPRLIVMDEPFGALDQQTRLLMGDELLRLWRETSATVLLITHALDEAAMLSDRVGVMSARPGLFIDIVETGWDRDRDSRIVSTPRFGDISARLWDKLRVESLKVLGAQNQTGAAH